MKFLDWWIEFSRNCPLDMTESEMAKQAWEAMPYDKYKDAAEFIIGPR